MAFRRDLTTIVSVVEAGAEWIVAGQAVFGTGDAETAARTLKAAAERAISGGPR